MEGNIARMISKFKSNEGGVYEDAVLTEDIANHPITWDYCTEIEDYIAEHLKSSKGKLTELEDRMVYLGEDFGAISRNRKETTNKTFNRPVYAAFKNDNVFRGETVALNDIWATEVMMTGFKSNAQGYKVDYEITLWDHFGLDIADLQNLFNILPLAWKVFASWLTLQHMRGYKPFLTKIRIHKSFSGTLEKGMSEREAERKQERIQDFIEEQKLKQSIEPKF